MVTLGGVRRRFTAGVPDPKFLSPGVTNIAATKAGGNSAGSLRAFSRIRRGMTVAHQTP
jgi:hypothetical protein